MIDPKLKGKVALITGANHGIGAATAKSLASQGVKVLIAYYRPSVPFSDDDLKQALIDKKPGDPFYYAMWQQKGEVIANKIRSSGGNAAAYEFDLGQPANIVKLFNLCEQKFGTVDILVVNHTHYSPDSFDPLIATDEHTPILANVGSINQHFSVNARATALMIREFAERHVSRKATWGRIITLTTTTRHSYSISYAASKQAIVSYSLSAAEELGKYGITVNIVCPGATQTGYITPEREKQIVEKTPLGRVGYSEDVADVITFLASKQGGWVTGNLIYASGGFLMLMNE